MSAKKNNLEKYFIPCCGGVVVDCSLQNKHRHSKLCNKLFDTPFHCLHHFASSHLSRAVQYQGAPCFPCKKEHSEVGKTDRAHFHCPVCSKTVFQRQHFIKHLKTHYTEPAQTVAAERDECHGNVDSGEEEDVEGNQRSHHEDVAHSADETEAPGSEGSGNEEKRSKVTKCRRDNPTSKSCPFCEKSMHPKSLARHCREMHNTEIVNVGTCVDEQRGLFLIRNSSRGDVAYPHTCKKGVRERKLCNSM